MHALWPRPLIRLEMQVGPTGVSLHRWRVVAHRTAAHTQLWYIGTTQGKVGVQTAVARLTWRGCTVDIECAGRKGIFPEADKDPVIQIANMVTLQGLSRTLVLGLVTALTACVRLRIGDSKPTIRNVFTLKSCAHIAGAEVLSFDSEEKLLLAWRDFIIAVRGASFPHALAACGLLRRNRSPALGGAVGLRRGHGVQHHQL
jgi:hypothetical protein